MIAHAGSHDRQMRILNLPLFHSSRPLPKLYACLCESYSFSKTWLDPCRLSAGSWGRHKRHR
jgi:hypothetical protein